MCMRGLHSYKYESNAFQWNNTKPLGVVKFLVPPSFCAGCLSAGIS